MLFSVEIDERTTFPIQAYFKALYQLSLGLTAKYENLNHDNVPSRDSNWGAPPIQDVLYAHAKVHPHF
jgi:hypothetical protein